MRGVAAAVTLLVVAGSLVTRRVREAARPIGLLLVLMVGLQILSWVDLLFEKVSGAEQFVNEGVLFLGLPLVLALFVAGVGAWFASAGRRPTRLEG